ncbi:hypothetical protein RvY_10784-2 [Ramazzottius varieornatus]|uniref:Uncharacterized protein n=1 Tax=Ramazzottius varieornatus TaxID=947166 RepID=A0A1D1VLQ8_RAMVA|nr:hypothetical protein RvY_10784-2 [Ramazzottius varieornatus]
MAVSTTRSASCEYSIVDATLAALLSRHWTWLLQQESAIAEPVFRRTELIDPISSCRVPRLVLHSSISPTSKRTSLSRYLVLCVLAFNTWWQHQQIHYFVVQGYGTTV